MKTFKATTLLALMTMAGGIAIAQPAETTGTEQRARGDRRGGMMERRGGEMGGPYGKLMAAKNLESLTPEQKTKIDTLLEQKKGEAQAMRQEMRTAMEAAKNSTDRQARRAAMEPLRQKHEAAQQQIDAALAGILTPEQLTELNKKTADRPGGPGKKDGKGDRKGKRDGKPRKDKDAGATDAATTGTQQVNPFSE